MKGTFAIAGCMIACVAIVAAGLRGQDDRPRQAEEPAVGGEQRAKAGEQPEPAAVERTRETIQMLDDIYKQTIVLITDKYVHDTDDFPAGSAAVELFDRVTKTGFHQVRLLDATGDPYDPENVAKTEFEKQAIKQLKAGKKTHAEVVQKGDAHYLRMATPIPVVMQKCVMCHPHYEDVKEGEPIGAISYELPIR